MTNGQIICSPIKSKLLKSFFLRKLFVKGRRAFVSECLKIKNFLLDGIEPQSEKKISPDFTQSPPSPRAVTLE